MEARDDLGANPLQPVLALDVGDRGEVLGPRRASLPPCRLRSSDTVLRPDGGCLLSATVHVCLGCERHSDKPFVCEPDDDSNCTGRRSTPMSILAWEIRNVEAGLMGIPCQAEMRGGRKCATNGRGWQCCACGAKRSLRVCMDEIVKAEPLPRVRALRRRAS